MSWPRLVVVGWLLLSAADAFAQTQVTSVSANPETFSPHANESTSITVRATPGVANLYVHVLNAGGSVVRDGLNLAEGVAGVYTTTWNGRDNGGQTVPPAQFFVRVFNAATATYLAAPPASIQVVEPITSITAAPDLLVPTGSNATTITVRGTPGQPGLQLRIQREGRFSVCGVDFTCQFPLVESNAGVYTATWTAVGRACCWSDPMIAVDGTYTIEVVDSAGRAMTQSASVRITGVSQVATAPAVFAAASGETTAIAVTAVAGLNLEARVYNAQNAVVRTLPLSGGGTAYTGVWDGRDGGGALAAVGSYAVRVFAAGGQYPYATQSFVQLTVGVTSVTASPDPFIPSGSNAAIVTVHGTPGQTGMRLRFQRDGRFIFCSVDFTCQFPLTETTPGVYTARWTGVGRLCCWSDPLIAGDGTYTIEVLDSAGHTLPQTGSLRITSVSTVVGAPSLFAPASGENMAITATAVAGLDLEARLFNSQNVFVRRLPLSGAGTTYTAAWDGRDAAGALAGVGQYTIRIFAAGGEYPYVPQAGVQVTVGVTSITAGTDPFIPTGSNATTITVQATPGQTGLRLQFQRDGRFIFCGADFTCQLALAETTPGVYTASWTAVGRSCCWSEPAIAADGTYSIEVIDSAGQRLPQTGSVRVAGVTHVAAAPAVFAAASGDSTTISVTAIAGLNLEARLYNHQNAVVRTLPLSGSGTAYTAVWDGRDATGAIASVGSYSIRVYASGGQSPYAAQPSVRLTVGVTSVSAAPDPFVPTGSNAATITVHATRGQTGLRLQFQRDGRVTFCGPDFTCHLPLVETTPGVYTASWTAVGPSCCWSESTIATDGPYTIQVIDSAGQALTPTGAVRVTGVSQATTAPNRFAAGGGTFTRITVTGGPGLPLQARVYNALTNVLTAVRTLTEASGVYTAEWDGRDQAGNFAGAATYRIQIVSTTSGQRYAPETSVIVEAGVFSVTASPDPFVPSGQNVVSITTQANAALTGLRARVANEHGHIVASGLPLVETGSVGTYVGSWDGTSAGAIVGNGTYTIRVLDGSGNEFPNTATVTVATARSLSVDPNPFEPGVGRTATITAQVAAGLQLEARIGTVAVVPLVAEDSTYSAAWNGTAASGLPVPAGSHAVFLHNRVTGARYSLSTHLTISDTTPPETAITGGPAEGSTNAAREAAFTWSATDNTGGPLTFSYRLDAGPFSPFTESTAVTLTGLANGDHTFEVRSRDSAGHVDASPAIRHFRIAQRSFLFDVSTGRGAFSEGAVVPFTAFVFDASDPATPLTSATVGVGLRVTAPAGDAVFGPAALPFNPANRQFAASLNTTGLALGRYQATFTFVDSAGETIGTEVRSFDLESSFSISIRADREAYRRAQAVELSGTATDENGSPLPLMPLTISVSSRGFVRTFTVLTNAQGNYQFIFNPLSTEAGRYEARIRAVRNGLTREAAATFVIHGLLLEPAVSTVDMSMNSAHTVPLRLRNIGETPLTDIKLSVADANPSDGANAVLPVVAVANLAPGATQDLTLDLQLPAGAAGAQPLLFSVNAATAESQSDTATVRVTAREARGLPVVTPAALRLGVKPGSSRALAFTLRNEGFGELADARVQVQDPATFNWVIVQEPLLGTVAPGATKAFAIVLAPQSGYPVGRYLVHVDVITASQTVPVLLTVDVTTSDARPVSVLVADDTGADVAGATVSLTSAALQTNYQASTDASGRAVFTEIPAGKYTLQVSGPRHAAHGTDVIVEPGTSTQDIDVLLSTKVVDFVFKVTPTTVADQYDVALVVTYSTDLIKPALVAAPSRLDFSFDRGESVPGELIITNSHTQASVTDVVVDATRFDPTMSDVLLTFAGESKTFVIPTLGPGETVRIPYRATHIGADADLSTRDLGSISITGKYVYSFRGEARTGATESAVFAFFRKPDGLRLQPPLVFVNDETDGVAGNLAYQGSTTIINLTNYRPFAIDFLGGQGETTSQPKVRALGVAIPEGVGADAVPLPLLGGASVFWTGDVASTRLGGRGDSTFFDVGGQGSLQRGLEAHLEQVVNGPVYAAVLAKWGDEPQAQGILFPISIVTIKPGSVSIQQGGGGGSGTSGGSPGAGGFQSFNNHGIVKIQLDQRVSLEREAFSATLDVLPAVSAVDALSVTLQIRDADGNDVADKFVVVDNQPIPATISAPIQLRWLIVPKVEAGGTNAAGISYTVAARISYSVGGTPRAFTTAAESFTVQPLPRLRLDYTIPYVVMGDIPFNLKVSVANVGHGPAGAVSIASAQPRIVENVSNVPISFGIDGSSATPAAGGLQAGQTTIDFGTIAPQTTKSGYWQMHATRRGFITDFASSLSHRTVNGKVLDPIIEQVNLHFQPAVGGLLTRSGGCTIGPLALQVRGLPSVPVAVGSGGYYISDIAPRSRLADPPGSYFIDVVEDGRVLRSIEIDVLADQPTDFVDLVVSNANLDSDGDSMPDCFEIASGLNRNDPADAQTDLDGDALTNLDEFRRGTSVNSADTDDDGLSDGQEVNDLHSDPRRRDTDGDGQHDGVEVRAGKDPNDPNSFPGLRSSVRSGDKVIYLDWDAPSEPVSEYRLNVCALAGAKECTTRVVAGSATSYTVDTDSNVLHSVELSTPAGDRVWSRVFATPGAYSFGEAAERPAHPILFVHGICFPGFVTDAGTWGVTTDFLSRTLGWRPGGTLAYDVTDLPPDDGPRVSSFDPAGHFYTATFGNCAGNYPTGGKTGVSHQADEVAGFVNAIRGNSGRRVQIVAHSMGGISSRAYLVDYADAAQSVASYTTYGSPHWGVPLASLYGGLGSDGARDLDVDCSSGQLDYSGAPFLNRLRMRVLPSGIRYFAIRGTSSLWSIPGGCLGARGDSVIPEHSANFGAVPSNAPSDQGPLTSSPVPSLTTDRKHTEQTSDFTAILCALSPRCMRVTLRSPVELALIAPDGRVQSRDHAGIPGAAYYSVNDADDHTTDVVLVPFAQVGEYQLRVTPKEGALPTDRYTIEVQLGQAAPVVVAADAEVGSIPAAGFSVKMEDGVNRAPVADAGPDLAVEATSASGAVVRLDTSRTADPDGDPVSAAWHLADAAVVHGTGDVHLPIGTHAIVLVVGDGRGGVARDTLVVRVVDSTPPVVSVAPSFETSAENGVTPQANAALRVFLASSTASDAVDLQPVRMSPQVNGIDITDATAFAPGATNVTFRFRDASGNIGTATSSVVVVASPVRSGLSGSGYNFPETSAYRATFSVDASGPTTPAAAVKYSYARTRLNFVSTSVSSVGVVGSTFTIEGAGTVNGVSGYTFRATAVDGSPDSFAIVIHRPDGAIYFSATQKPLAGGSFTLSAR